MSEGATPARKQVDVDATLRGIHARLEGFDGKTLQIPEVLNEILGDIYDLTLVLEEMRLEAGVGRS